MRWIFKNSYYDASRSQNTDRNNNIKQFYLKENCNIMLRTRQIQFKIYEIIKSVFYASKIIIYEN